MIAVMAVVIIMAALQSQLSVVLNCIPSSARLQLGQQCHQDWQVWSIPIIPPVQGDEKWCIDQSRQRLSMTSELGLS
uniref:Uncharacterized protein n=1 Tax=Romanomermis culicivorax TaxID=13658 RepID=A0A915L709_ROMCU